jgi:hypothetical protein
MIYNDLSAPHRTTARGTRLARQEWGRLADGGGTNKRRDGNGIERGPGVTQPPHNFNYFFFAAFFLAFFFAAIIVSFKVNLGIVQVRRLFRTTIAQFFERLASLLRRSSRKIRENHARCVNSMPQSKKNATSL